MSITVTYLPSEYIVSEWYTYDTPNIWIGEMFQLRAKHLRPSEWEEV